MKYKFITSILLVLTWVYTPLCAQTLSFEGGYLATKYRNMPPFEDSKGGFQFGVGYLHPIKDSMLFIKTGLHYQQLDGRGTINYLNQINQVVLSYEKTQELYYLQLPILLQLDIIKQQKIRIGIFAGLSANLLLRAWHNPQRWGVEHNVTPNFESMVLGYQTGACAAIPITTQINMLLLYTYGSNITSVQKQTTQSGFATNLISAGLAYRLK